MQYAVLHKRGFTCHPYALHTRYLDVCCPFEMPQSSSCIGGKDPQQGPLHSAVSFSLTKLLARVHVSWSQWKQKEHWIMYPLVSPWQIQCNFRNTSMCSDFFCTFRTQGTGLICPLCRSVSTWAISWTTSKSIPDGSKLWHTDIAADVYIVAT